MTNSHCNKSHSPLRRLCSPSCDEFVSIRQRYRIEGGYPFCKLQCFKKISNGTVLHHFIPLKDNPQAPLYFSVTAMMKQQELSPNLMLILWLVAMPAAVMGAAIAEGGANSFAESEDPTAWGARLIQRFCKMFCKMFSESSPCQQLAAWQLQYWPDSLWNFYETYLKQSQTLETTRRPRLNYSYRNFLLPHSFKHSFVISERGKFYTTRFGRSDPSLTRQVIIGFSIGLSVCLFVQAGGRLYVWREV